MSIKEILKNQSTKKQKLEIGTIVKCPIPKYGTHIIYLANIKKTFVMPIFCSAKDILKIKEQKSQLLPNIFKTLSSVIKLSKLKVKSITIYLVKGKDIYCRLNLQKDKESYELDIDVIDGLCLANQLKVPIYANDYVYKFANRIREDLKLP